MIDHVFISFCAVQMYDLIYIHLCFILSLYQSYNRSKKIRFHIVIIWKRFTSYTSCYCFTYNLLILIEPMRTLEAGTLVLGPRKSPMIDVFPRERILLWSPSDYEHLERWVFVQIYSSYTLSLLGWTQVILETNTNIRQSKSTSANRFKRISFDFFSECVHYRI